MHGYLKAPTTLDEDIGVLGNLHTKVTIAHEWYGVVLVWKWRLVTERRIAGQGGRRGSGVRPYNGRGGLEGKRRGINVGIEVGGMEILFYFRSKKAMDDCFDYCNLPLALWDELNIHRKSLGPE